MYRAPNRRQLSDPTEDRYDHPPESPSAHRSANCTMAAGATALDWHTEGDVAVQGGDLRHRQGDLTGGTSLYDVLDGWQTYGQSFEIREGPWADVLDTWEWGDGVLLQGLSEVFTSGCAATFDGPHCIFVPPDESAGDMAVADPLCADYHRESLSTLRAYAEGLWGGIIQYGIIGGPMKPTPVAADEQGTMIVTVPQETGLYEFPDPDTRVARAAADSTVPGLFATDDRDGLGYIAISWGTGSTATGRRLLYVKAADVTTAPHEEPATYDVTVGGKPAGSVDLP